MRQIAAPHRGRAPAFEANGDAVHAAIVLLGHFRLLVGGERVGLPPASQRLLAYVVLAGSVVSRARVAGVLWSGIPEERAHTCLRATLTRLGARAPGVLRADGAELTLAAGVSIDLHEAQLQARQLLSSVDGRAAVIPPDPLAAVALFSNELLPGWYDDWVLLEAESWRQLRLHALEVLSIQLAVVGRFGEAVAAARAAVGVDPLRESAHAALITVHLREGNQAEALRTFEQFRRHLHTELGLEPTQTLNALLPNGR